MDFEKILEEIKNIIRKYLSENDFQLFLFGSWAKGRAHPTSDIDIAISGRKPVDDLTLIEIKEEIDELKTLRTIEIVDLSQTDEYFKKNVLNYAREV